MRQSIHESINTEVEQYRRTLVHFAKAREWETFEKKAGMLFDYLESIELTILERKFYSVFIMILAVLVGIVIVILKADGRFCPVITRYKEYVVLLAACATCYELYFYLNYRLYVEVKMSRYQKSKEQFIRNIENDFREHIMGSGG
ncbi:MAG TPA: hypothetical protein VL122_10195 [Nitrospirota bacterium]|nr:hypothetical protein [Nitrospirota bacterium]